ncbi:Dihydrosphingosine 1-phosphate phosphatase [Erysiphe neolycopersici]|uniref:Dihydrosphingosine 1-phosphate phosphatase n=1 Tax=Erysiphe neolycopersici TaxID=212602 RepID=A0A420HP60_9PEZI|nr:Dihydrosphingosine 1-phosphate phosphatase [Erysiphe neolycopersici]
MVLKQVNAHSKDIDISKNHPESCSLASTIAFSAIEAGLHSTEHYKRTLTPWRFRLRQLVIPWIQRETPYLARMQNKMRVPVLDSYFAVTANLGTHTFFMLLLPILFWCGYTSLGRGMVHILANGVFLTGLLKDLLSLPRPLAPPLHRITMSRSASLEYGFPSTHSANAASVAVYALNKLHTLKYRPEESKKILIEGLVYLYVFTIVIGRLYCGMHGFIDVSVGCLIGIIISLFECAFGNAIDNFIFQSSWVAPATVAFFMFFLILIHPKPADNCPCFDDTIAFAGVIMGIEAGGWHYANSDWSWNSPVPATVPFDLHQMGFAVAFLRIIVGVIVIFAWRKIIKMALLKYLPCLLCKVDAYGFMIYQNCLKLAKSFFSYLKLEILKSIIFHLTNLLKSLRNITPGFSFYLTTQPSIQNYDSLSCSVKCQQDCLKPNDRCGSLIFQCSSQKLDSHISTDLNAERDFAFIQISEESELSSEQEQKPLELELFSSQISLEQTGAHDFKQNEVQYEIVSNDQGLCSRFNVGIITKLIVYVGIGWLSVETNPIIFELIGLGLERKESRN